jgi:RluA family pseudouridine synthase
MKTLRWCVGKEDDLKKLPAFLSTKDDLGLPSQKKARQLLESGKCSVNGLIRTFASTVVHTGDKVVVIQNGSEAAAKTPASIVYEDADIFIIEKPSGLKCEQSSFEKAFSRPCFMVHRLDKETSGLVIVANTLEAAERLHELFLHREVAKKYLAIVDGEMHDRRGSICASLKMQNRIGSSIYWGVAKEGGKPSRTDYEVIISKKSASLVLLTPHTGRTHQLRVHMASIGHPILGDYHYADRFICSLRPNRHLLHAWKLRFVHPLRNILVQCKSNIPNDFQDCALKLFGDNWETKL